MYSVKAVSQATGITPETLRAWERRYGAVKPLRESNGRRTYNHEDVTRLRKLKQLSERGHTISRLAPLSQSELDELCARLDGELTSTATLELVSRLLDATERADEAACDEVLAQAVCILPPQRLIRALLSPALVEVGVRWDKGSLSVGQEHLLSTCIRRLIMSLINTYHRSDASIHVIFATPSGEQHTFGSLFATYIAATVGIRTTYLDSPIPPAELDALARNMQAQAVAISLVDRLNKEQSLEQLAHLSELAEDAFSVWAGGACTAELKAEQRLPAGCMFIDDLEEFEAWLTMPAVK